MKLKQAIATVSTVSLGLLPSGLAPIANAQDDIALMVRPLLYKPIGRKNAFNPINGTNRDGGGFVVVANSAISSTAGIGTAYAAGVVVVSYIAENLPLVTPLPERNLKPEASEERPV